MKWTSLTTDESLDYFVVVSGECDLQQSVPSKIRKKESKFRKLVLPLLKFHTSDMIHSWIVN